MFQEGRVVNSFNKDARSMKQCMTKTFPWTAGTRWLQMTFDTYQSMMWAESNCNALGMH